MIFIGADLNTIKTSAIITGVPILFIMLVMIIGWMRWMVKDYGYMSAENLKTSFKNISLNPDDISKGVDSTDNKTTSI